MKLFQKMLLISMVVVSMYSCKKDNDDEPQDSPAGYWKGFYGSGTNPATQNYSWLFRENGTLRVYSQSADTTAGSKAEGTYSVNGSTIKTSYTYISGAISGSFSTTASTPDDFETMSGTYGSGSATTGGGTFILTRQ